MIAKAEAPLHEVLALPDAERAEVVVELLASLDARPDDGDGTEEVERRVATSGFPFAIEYRVTGQTILVLAVHHQRRHPDFWADRTIQSLRGSTLGPVVPSSPSALVLKTRVRSRPSTRRFT